MHTLKEMADHLVYLYVFEKNGNRKDAVKESAKLTEDWRINKGLNNENHLR